MEQTTTLSRWMSENGYTHKTLARELELSYELIFKIAKGDRRTSSNFEMKFINRFGRDAARQVFADSRLLAMLESA